MRVAALLSWYREPPEALSRVVAALEGFADVLVAVDGAYEMFMDAEGRSSEAEVAAIRDACAAASIDLVLMQPAEAWVGNEVAKRDRMFRLGDALDVDWFFIVDGDFVAMISPDALAQLAVVEEDVVDVLLVDRQTNEAGEQHLHEYLHPLLFRAGRPIRVGPTHFHWHRDGDAADQWLWGCGNTPQVPRANLAPLIHVHHEWWHREDDRRCAQWLYYIQRDGQRRELSPFAPTLVAATAEED